MTENSKLGVRLLGIAIVLGVLVDLLLRETPWGINVALWLGMAVLAVTALLRGSGPVRQGHVEWMLPLALLFALGFVWRDSPMLTFLDACLVLLLLSLALVRANAGSFRLAYLWELAWGSGQAAFFATLGFPLLVFQDVAGKEVPRTGWSGLALAVGRGVLLALPPLFVFSALLASADAVFAGYLKEIIDFDWGTVFSHLFVIGFCTWIVGGYLRGLLLSERKPLALGNRSSPELGITEVGTVLGLLNLLFLGFVIVQLRYLFGGAPLVRVTRGLTYAEYARHGFFELAAATGLALPLLLFAHWCLGRSGSGERAFRWLAGAQLGLLFVTMISALQRMRLYQQEYGLTELRLYGTAFMGWLAVVFIWFAVTVLRGRREKFAFGALAAGLVLAAALHFLNPDELIVRVNTARAVAGRQFDAYYVASLSDDAVPGLVEALPNLSSKDQQIVAKRLLGRWPPSRPTDWRTWNLSRARARDLLQERMAELLKARNALQ